MFLLFARWFNLRYTVNLKSLPSSPWFIAFDIFCAKSSCYFFLLRHGVFFLTSSLRLCYIHAFGSKSLFLAFWTVFPLSFGLLPLGFLHFPLWLLPVLPWKFFFLITLKILPPLLLLFLSAFLWLLLWKCPPAPPPPRLNPPHKYHCSSVNCHPPPPPPPSSSKCNTAQELLDRRIGIRSRSCTYNYGSGSWRPKNVRIRIRNSGVLWFEVSFHPWIVRPGQP
jgi:hypothetical protein